MKKDMYQKRRDKKQARMNNTEEKVNKTSINW